MTVGLKESAATRIFNVGAPQSSRFPERIPSRFLRMEKPDRIELHLAHRKSIMSLNAADQLVLAPTPVPHELPAPVHEPLA